MNNLLPPHPKPNPNRLHSHLTHPQTNNKHNGKSPGSIPAVWHSQRCWVGSTAHHQRDQAPAKQPKMTLVHIHRLNGDIHEPKRLSRTARRTALRGNPPPKRRDMEGESSSSDHGRAVTEATRVKNPGRNLLGPWRPADRGRATVKARTLPFRRSGSRCGPWRRLRVFAGADRVATGRLAGQRERLIPRPGHGLTEAR